MPICRRREGYKIFHDMVDDPRSLLETNPAQMTAYSIYLGMIGGMIDRSHSEKADRMPASAKSEVGDFGSA